MAYFKCEECNVEIKHKSHVKKHLATIKHQINCNPDMEIQLRKQYKYRTGFNNKLHDIIYKNNDIMQYIQFMNELTKS